MYEFKGCSDMDMYFIDRIANRAEELNVDFGEDRDDTDLRLDIQCVHETIGLRLEDMLGADDFNFLHDIYGIMDHLDRETGEMLDFFIPRFVGHSMDRATA